MQTISIPLSKTKIILLFTGAILFVAGGCWLIAKASTSNGGVVRNVEIIRIAGTAAVLFFGFCAVYAARKFFNTRPGFIVEESGITDNSGGISAGYIPWSDILEITTMFAQRQKYIMIHVKNPEEYINKQHSFLKRKMMALNQKLYGSPLAVSANSLTMSFGELYNLLRDRFEERKTREQ